MFCMLLRKHFTGARLLELTQPSMERLLDFRFETLDELGDRVERRLVRENRTLVLNVYRAYERSYVEHDLRRWAQPLVEARIRLAAQPYGVTEDQVAFMTEVFTQTLASIVLSWVERGMPSSVIERMDDFDILIEGCLDYTMERLAQKGKKTDGI